jgi:hypothetical protein
MGFRRFGRGGGDPVEAGGYTVSVKIGERTYDVPLTVVRADGYSPDVDEDSAALEAWLGGEGQD